MEKERQKEALSIVFPGMVNGALILYNKKQNMAPGQRTLQNFGTWKHTVDSRRYIRMFQGAYSLDLYTNSASYGCHKYTENAPL